MGVGKLVNPKITLKALGIIWQFRCLDQTNLPYI
jgi:hypothetical protein